MEKNYITIEISYESLFKVVAILVVFLFTLVLYQYYCFYTTYYFFCEKFNALEKSISEDISLKKEVAEQAQYSFKDFFNKVCSLITPGTVQAALIVTGLAMLGLGGFCIYSSVIEGTFSGAATNAPKDISQAITPPGISLDILQTLPSSSTCNAENAARAFSEHPPIIPNEFKRL